MEHDVFLVPRMKLLRAFAMDGVATPLNTVLSAFPLLTVDEFRCACLKFTDRVDAVGGAEGLGWLSVRWLKKSNPSILRISKRSMNITISDLREIPLPSPDVIDMDESPENLLEDDQEALPRDSDYETDTRFNVVYDIVLSPTYQVPVLFFVLPDKPQVGSSEIEAIYQYLVPTQYRLPLNNVGVMGGISFGYHPGSGLPAYFVHPCNTANAMKNIVGDRDIDPEAYLLIWLGLVGNCVNLHVPSLLADGGVSSSASRDRS